MVFFVDANIIFAASISPDGAARALFDLAAARGHRLVASPYVIEEARRNVDAKYPDQRPDAEALVAHLTPTTEPGRALVAWAEEHVVDKDAPVLAAALASDARYLVTGDRRHFGHLFDREIESLTVIGLASALEIAMAES